VFPQVGRRLGAFTDQEEVRDGYLLGTAQGSALAWQGTPVFDEMPQAVDAAQGVDEERVTAS